MCGIKREEKSVCVRVCGMKREEKGKERDKYGVGFDVCFIVKTGALHRRALSRCSQLLVAAVARCPLQYSPLVPRPSPPLRLGIEILPQKRGWPRD